MRALTVTDKTRRRLTLYKQNHNRFFSFIGPTYPYIPELSYAQLNPIQGLNYLPQNWYHSRTKFAPIVTPPVLCD